VEGGVVIAASKPRPDPAAERLLVIDPAGGPLVDAHVRDLPSFLAPGDLLVVNDAATLPASLRSADGAIELRLFGREDEGKRWHALLFGPGDFRTPTEARPTPREVHAGETLELGAGLSARVAAVDPEEPRLVDLEFDRSGGELYRALYAAGRPVQYAHVPEPLALWDTQNRFAARPWAFEQPSAGRPLSFGVLLSLRRGGVELGWITHAAGLSSTGSERLDRRLPGRERYSVGEEAVARVRAAKARGARVVAAGTTVVRALESAALLNGGSIARVEGETTLVIGPGFRPAVVDGVLSGMHARDTTHFALLSAFAPATRLEEARAHAEREGYLEHEFGDSCLVLPHLTSARAAWKNSSRSSQ
jgi:S-adenosylmethionine:tRNA ribosyltransferase-isomerase